MLNTSSLKIANGKHLHMSGYDEFKDNGNSLAPRCGCKTFLSFKHFAVLPKEGEQFKLPQGVAAK